MKSYTLLQFIDAGCIRRVELGTVEFGTTHSATGGRPCGLCNHHRAGACKSLMLMEKQHDSESESESGSGSDSEATSNAATGETFAKTYTVREEAKSTGISISEVRRRRNAAVNIKKVHVVVNVNPGEYECGSGTTKDGMSFRHITNFSSWQLEHYTNAVETFTGAGEFGVSEKAFGFDDEQGNVYRLSSDSKGFYATDFGFDLSGFWNHFHTIEQETHNVERVRKVACTKVHQGC